jgi:cyanophycin synthetase
VNLTSPRALRKAVQLARMSRKEVLIEEHVPGENFRIVVMDGRVLHVVRRDPAFVVGDGELRIGALIEQKNERRREAGITHQIPVNSALRSTLRGRGLKLRSKPGPGERVVLHEICNFGVGGENEVLPLSEVHPDNLEVFKRCVEPLPLRLAGLDFITPDIRKSYREVGGAFNEINASPMLCYIIGLEYDTAASIEVLGRRLKV